jgi:hypothetical protein
MVADATVGDLLLEALLQPASAGLSTADLNAVVDGFPRTAVQVWLCVPRGRTSAAHAELLMTPLCCAPPTAQVDFVQLLLEKLTR